MASQIDVTQPPDGNPTCAGTRNNFVIASSEITALQALSGSQGPAGPPPNITLGPTATLGPGSNATASLTGTTPNYTLTFGIPQGAPGTGGGIPGVSIGNTPTAGQTIVATATNAALWQTPTAPPSTGVTFPIRGTNTAAQAQPTGSLLQLANADGTSTQAQIDSSGGGVSTLELRNIGATMATPSVPATNTQLGFFRALGWTGTALGGGFEIQVVTSPTTAWTTASNGTVVQFNTCADGEATRSRKGFIGNLGGWVFGNATNGDMGLGTMNIAGGLFVNGVSFQNWIMANFQVNVPAGSTTGTLVYTGP